MSEFSVSEVSEVSIFSVIEVSELRRAVTAGAVPPSLLHESAVSMSFLTSLQQVVADVTSSVSSLSLNSARRFSREPTQPEDGGGPVPPSTGGHRSRLGPRLVPSPGTTTGGASKFRSGSQSGQGGLGVGNKQQVSSVLRPPHHQQLQSVAPRREHEAPPLPQLQCGDRYTYWPEYDPAQSW